MNFSKSIRGRLIFWYLTSLISITAFFYFGIHIYALPYGNILFIILLFILALEGWFIVHKITDSLSRLSSKIETITSKNLDEKVTGIENGDEIGELARSFNKLLSRLKEAFLREQQFIGDVAHELKTPLATLRSSTEIALAKDRDKKEYQHVLAESLTDIDRLNKTLKNVLDLAWTEADQAKNLTKSVDLSELIEELREIAVKMATQKSIEVYSQIDKNIAVLGDKEKLSRSILNFLDNAIRYTPGGGRIEFTLNKKVNDVSIIIKDTGEGILAEDLPHIFDRFYRGAASSAYRGSKSSKTFGSGLGLAISQAIIKAHKGEIDVKSKVGQGTNFTIILPLKS